MRFTRTITEIFSLYEILYPMNEKQVQNLDWSFPCKDNFSIASLKLYGFWQAIMSSAVWKFMSVFKVSIFFFLSRISCHQICFFISFWIDEITRTNWLSFWWNFWIDSNLFITISLTAKLLCVVCNLFTIYWFCHSKITDSFIQLCTWYYYFPRFVEK